MSDKIADRLPYFIGAVIVLSFLLLMVVFRSILVPLKAAIMNVLSIGAAYGVIVAIFQWGWGAGLFGVARVAAHRQLRADADVRHPLRPVDGLRGLPAVPGARGVPRSTGDNTESVATGIATTARVITSAALIMISVFLSFVLGDDPTVKMIGIGLATAIFVDATLIRMVLVPSTMKLLGDANWWLPEVARPHPPQPRHRGRVEAAGRRARAADAGVDDPDSDDIGERELQPV